MGEPIPQARGRRRQSDRNIAGDESALWAPDKHHDISADTLVMEKADFHGRS